MVINIDSANSNKTEEMVFAISEKLGNVTSVHHTRSINPVEYKTKFVFGTAEITVNAAFSSGYPGSGSNSFFRLMKKLGFNEAELKTKIYDTPESITNLDFEL